MLTLPIVVRALVVSGAMALAGLALASTAAASAHLSPTNDGIKLAGSVTLTLADGQATVCTMPADQIGFVGPPPYYDSFFQVASDLSTGRLRASCEGGGQFDMLVGGQVAWAGPNYFAVGWSNTLCSQCASPYGLYSGSSSSGIGGIWTNGSGGVPTRVTVSDQEVGHTYPGGPNSLIKVSGTLDVTTSTGGALVATQ